MIGLIMRLEAVGAAAEQVADRVTQSTAVVAEELSEQDRRIRDFVAKSIVGHLLEAYIEMAEMIRKNPLLDPTRLAALEGVIRRFDSSAGGINFSLLRSGGTTVRRSTHDPNAGSTDLATSTAQGGGTSTGSIGLR